MSITDTEYTAMPAREYRTADYLKTPEEVAEYLDAALEDGEPALVLLALRNAADAAQAQSGHAETKKGQPLAG